MSKQRISKYSPYSNVPPEARWEAVDSKGNVVFYAVEPLIREYAKRRLVLTDLTDPMPIQGARAEVPEGFDYKRSLRKMKRSKQ